MHIMIEQKEATVIFEETEPVYVWADEFKIDVCKRQGQSLPGKVSHMVDVRFLKCECIRRCV